MVDYYPVIGYNIFRNKERGNKNDSRTSNVTSRN